jgi:hypothetical protein
MFALSSMVIMQPLANLNRTTVKTIIALNNKALFHIGLEYLKKIYEVKCQLVVIKTSFT